MPVPAKETEALARCASQFATLHNFAGVNECQAEIPMIQSANKRFQVVTTGSLWSAFRPVTL
jgi:hypothetical protein